MNKGSLNGSLLFDKMFDIAIPEKYDRLLAHFSSDYKLKNS